MQGNLLENAIHFSKRQLNACVDGMSQLVFYLKLSRLGLSYCSQNVDFKQKKNCSLRQSLLFAIFCALNHFSIEGEFVLPQQKHVSYRKYFFLLLFLSQQQNCALFRFGAKREFYGHL